MGIAMSMLLAGQRDRAQDGNEDEDRGHLEGKQQVAEEHFAEVAGRDDVFSQPGGGQVGAGGKKDERQQADQDRYPWNANNVCSATPVRALFLPGIEQHDDESKEHHDCAGIDDDLGGSQKFCAEQEEEHSERTHDHDQREGAIDRMALQQQVQGCYYTKAAEKDEENQIHG